MNLFALADRHTLPTTLIGTVAGFSGALFEHLDQATHLISFVGACAGTATAIAGAIIMFRKAVRNREQRRKWKRHEPFDDNLEF